MKPDTFSTRKRFVGVSGAEVAYADEGAGPPVLLLHGCPFSSFIWRDIIARLRGRFRCLAPDLLGLGDTETPMDFDWSVRSQVRMVTGLLDALGIAAVHVVGHDQGGAVAQLLAAYHPERVNALVPCNAEAYDNWHRGRSSPSCA